MPAPPFSPLLFLSLFLPLLLAQPPTQSPVPPSPPQPHSSSPPPQTPLLPPPVQTPPSPHSPPLPFQTAPPPHSYTIPPPPPVQTPPAPPSQHSYPPPVRSHSPPPPPPQSPPPVQTPSPLPPSAAACKSTLYPKLCRSLLKDVGESPSDPYGYGKFSVKQSLKQAKKLTKVFKDFLKSAFLLLPTRTRSPPWTTAGFLTTSASITCSTSPIRNPSARWTQYWWAILRIT